MPENERLRRQNTERFRRLLAGQVNPDDRAVLLRLLAEYEAEHSKAQEPRSGNVAAG